jgi:hypothetical protein
MLQHALDNGASAWIGPTDVTASLLMDLYDDWLLARAAWRDGGDEKDFKAYDALTKSLNAWLSDLGLNTIQRGKLGLAIVKAKSKLDEMRERKARLLAGPPAG